MKLVVSFFIPLNSKIAFALSEDITLLKQSRKGIMHVSLKLGGKYILESLKSVLDTKDRTLTLKNHLD